METILSFWWVPGFLFLTFILYRFNTKSVEWEKKWQESNKQVVQLNGDNVSLKNKIIDLENKETQFDTDIKNLVIELNNERQIKVDNKSAIDILKGKNTFLQDAINTLTVELTASKQLIAELSEKKSSTPAQPDSFSAPEEAHSRITELEKTNEEQKFAILTLQKQREQLEQWVNEIKNELKNKEEVLKQREKEIQYKDFELASAFSNAGVSEFDLRHQVGRMEVQLYERQQEIDKLQKQLEQKENSRVVVQQAPQSTPSDDKARIEEMQKSLNEYQEVLQQIFDQLNEEVQHRKDAETQLKETETRLYGLVNDLEHKSKSLEKELQEYKQQS